MLVHGVFVCAFLEENLADFDISVKCRVMDGAERFLRRLLVDPDLYDIFILVLRVTLDLFLNYFKQFAENDWLVLDRSVMQKGQSDVILNLPQLHIIWHFLKQCF